MGKNVIKLSESTLQRIVKESIHLILKESVIGQDLFGKYQKTRQYYLSMTDK